ncbi:MAG: CoA transferase, partial [Pacificimonas sp.]
VWTRLAAAMGQPELAADERFVDHEARGRHQTLLDDIISDWTKKFSSKDLLKLLADNGVPAGKIFTAPDMLNDPQYKAREALVEVEHPEHNDLVMQAPAPRLSATPGEIRWAGPTELGQHNEEVYGELLGMDAGTRADLAERGII